MNSPRSPRSLERSQRGNTRPLAQVEVKSGSDRIDQLSTPRYRVTTTSSSSQFGVTSGTSTASTTATGVGVGGGFFGYSSPRLSQDQKTVLVSHDKLMRRVQLQHKYPAVSPREQENLRASSSARSQNIVPEIPSAVRLLTSYKNEHEPASASSSSPPARVGLFPSVNAHAASGMAGLILAESNFLEDRDAKFGTKLQKHELCNSRVPSAREDEIAYPIYVPTSGRRRENTNSTAAQTDSVKTSCGVKILAPAPSAVRSLAVSGIDTSRVEDRPVAPSYFSTKNPNANTTREFLATRIPDTANTMIERPTRNGCCRYPLTNWMSQPEQNSGHFLDTRGQFDPNNRGLFNASSYILEDKLHRKATYEVRISKRGNNEEAVVERALAEIASKRAKTEKRVAAKRQARLDYEERVGAGL